MIKLLKILKEATNSPKAIILAGAPGAGKGTVLGGLNLSNLKVFNLDDTIATLSKQQGFTLNQKAASAEDRSKFATAMAAATKNLKTELIPNAIANGDSFILDGTSSSIKNTVELKKQLEDAGYDVMMLYVYTDLETSLERNEKRFEKSKGEDRSLYPGAVLSTWLSVAKNFETYQQLFGDNFVSVSNVGKDETLKDIEAILQKYIYPFTPKDAKPKTDKEKAKSKEQAAKLNADMQIFLNSDQTQNIINSSVSAQEAQSKIKQFLS